MRQTSLANRSKQSTIVKHVHDHEYDMIESRRRSVCLRPVAALQHWSTMFSYCTLCTDPAKQNMEVSVGACNIHAEDCFAYRYSMQELSLLASTFRCAIWGVSRTPASLARAQLQYLTWTSGLQATSTFIDINL